MQNEIWENDFRGLSISVDFKMIDHLVGFHLIRQKNSERSQIYANFCYSVPLFLVSLLNFFSYNIKKHGCNKALYMGGTKSDLGLFQGSE